MAYTAPESSCMIQEKNYQFKGYLLKNDNFQYSTASMQIKLKCAIQTTKKSSCCDFSSQEVKKFPLRSLVYIPQVNNPHRMSRYRKKILQIFTETEWTACEFYLTTPLNTLIHNT